MWVFEINMTPKILTIIGARPQFIKAAPVSWALGRQGIEEVIVHTGQHFDSNMSDIFFDVLEIPNPAYNLGIGGGSHGENTGRMIEALEKVLQEVSPDLVIVYGDTNSTLAGALAAAKLNIPVAHVEAGLRSFNRRMPEEINRILTDHASTMHFVPTQTAEENLYNEGVSGDGVHLVGDVMYDASILYGAKAKQTSYILQTLKLQPKSYVLATIHRAENTDFPERLSTIFHALGRFNILTILPLHPRTRKLLEGNGIELPSNVKAIDPVGYLDMMLLTQNAMLVATDSGGVQKESFFSRVPCVTLRDQTEWIELIEGGWNRLASPNSEESIIQALGLARGSCGDDIEPYGSGNASTLISEQIIRDLN